MEKCSNCGIPLFPLNRVVIEELGLEGISYEGKSYFDLESCKAHARMSLSMWRVVALALFIALVLVLSVHQS